MINKHVVGMSHIDLGFTVTEDELDELLIIFAERMLACLDNDSELCFSIEQMYHYKKLLKQRPDLFERIKIYIASGRIEIMGAMASSMETNFPNGECFIRNQKLGLDFAKEYFNSAPHSGWLIDTFGLNAQIPQIYRQFGFGELFANRFGGDKPYEIFNAKGIDGSEILVIGRDAYANNVENKYTAFVYSRAWTHTDALFDSADRLSGASPHLCTYYIENEGVLSLHYVDLTRQRMGRENENWMLSTYKKFIDDLKSSGNSYPTIHGDLNPEFTGTFALRTPVKLFNRKAEISLLAAERLYTLSNNNATPEDFTDLWWMLAFVQFHDVFTGSHSDKTFYSVRDKCSAICTAANLAIDKSVSLLTEEHKDCLTYVNSLPWKRQLWVKLPDKYSARKISLAGEILPIALRNNDYYCKLTLPALGGKTITVGEKLTLPAIEKSGYKIKNEFMTLSLDAKTGAYTLSMPDGGTVIENASDYLAVQQDTGWLQVETPIGKYIGESEGCITVSEAEKSPMGEQITVSGSFPDMQWNGVKSSLDWSIRFSLVYGQNGLSVKICLDWLGEAARIRFRVPTVIASESAIYEIPFGTVERKPYPDKPTARGEWPAQRFVAYEDGKNGIALINNGVAGAELEGRTIATTLIRAHGKSPKMWITPNSLTSQHGKSTFDFMLVPYAGSWKNANIVRMAQEFNEPTLVFENRRMTADGVSLASVDKENIVVSAIKPCDDGSGDIVMRCYEAFGEITKTVVYINNIKEAVTSDVFENIGEIIPIQDDRIELRFKPFEIRTIRVKRKK